jgi:CheY-like chemotaxis protein
MSPVQWCELVSVQDGYDAAECLQKQKFDGFIIADRLPRGDAFELIEHLKGWSLNAGIPIVMLTGEDDIDTMRRGFKAGVTFFAVKPHTRERFFRLFSAVRGAMESEKRRHHRLPYRTPVTCTLGDESRYRFMTESVDIGEGGMALRLAGGVEVDQVMELEFLLPQVARPAHPVTRKPRKLPFAGRETPLSGPQKLRARVRYIAAASGNLGLDFVGLTAAQREVIQHYITGGS